MPVDTRPNIILIMTDQQRGDCLGVDGHPCLQTPNMDALAGAGTRFRRAYTTCPSCIPARRCLLSGQFPGTNGMPGFVGGVPLDGPTLPGLLAASGYQTHLVGRHMHQHPESARNGYQSTSLASGYTVDEYWNTLRAETGEVDGFGAHGLPFNGWTAHPWQHEERLHPTNWIVNESLRFLEQRDRTCPFFLTASFYAPHPPLCPPPFYMDRYLRLRQPEPAFGSWATPPTGHELGRNPESARVHLQGEPLRSAMAGYFGLINHIDDQIYRLLSARHRAGFDASNTLVIFTSDHGEMLGDHYYFRKCEPYEGSARIPFILKGGHKLGMKAGQVLDTPVCLEDLMPTCLELAGCTVPEGVDGRSLLPLLRGDAGAKDAWRTHLHGEHAPCYSREQANHFIVDGRYKYIWRPLFGTQQLFDLQTDPKELRDLSLSTDPTHAETLATLQAALVDRLRDRPEGFVRDGKLVQVAEYPGLLPALAERARTAGDLTRG